METSCRALELCVEAGITRQAYFDARLAALMSREGTPVVITENTADFRVFEGTRATDPFN